MGLTYPERAGHECDNISGHSKIVSIQSWNDCWGNIASLTSDRLSRAVSGFLM